MSGRFDFITANGSQSVQINLADVHLSEGGSVPRKDSMIYLVIRSLTFLNCYAS